MFSKTNQKDRDQIESDDVDSDSDLSTGESVMMANVITSDDLNVSEAFVAARPDA
jgi:hypothetical protein